ncbi:azurin [bacterium]|nr:azurin [bacterium]
MRFLILFLTSLSFLSNVDAFASNCSFDLEGNKMMQFSASTINIDKTCSSFTIKFKNTSDLPIDLAGHNVVVSKSSDFDNLITLIDPANGINQGYLPPSPAVVGKTPLLGPNETYDLVIDLNKLDLSQQYVYWCSFPGHYGIMKGNLVFN